jgi:predicted exporter
MTISIRLRALAALALVVAACVLCIAHTRFVADLSAFMPRSPTPRQQLLVEQLRDGVVARLVMIGIAGHDAQARAQVSRALAARLRQERETFTSVQNGDSATRERDEKVMFDNRYLLAPDVTPDHFTVEHLHDSIADTLESLAGGAGLALRSLFARDPTGELLQTVERFEGSSAPQVRDGVWATPDGTKALLLAQTRAAGSDIDAQAQVVAHIREVFAGLPGRTADMQLLLGGTGVFSVAARATIESEIARLALASFTLVTILLLVVYRSLSLFVLGMLPVVLGALVGVACVSLGFGQVHSLTLGFGTTLIGEAVDYSIYYFLQCLAGGRGQAAPAGFWRTIALGVSTSIAGYCVMLFSGFPSLAQLGLYSISGLVAAALAARFLLPALVPARPRLRDLREPARRLDRLFDSAARARWPALLAVLVSLAFVATHGDRIWNRRLIALSPIPDDVQRVDNELRTGLGVSDTRYVVVLEASDEQTALELAERSGDVLDGLAARGVIAGYTSPAFVLPSLARQRARQEAIPPDREMHARMAQALRGLPVHADRLNGFFADLQAARARPPLTRTDLEGTSAELLVDSLVVPSGRGVLVLMPLHSLPAQPAAAQGGTAAGHASDGIDVGAVEEALRAAGLGQVKALDILAETTDVFDRYLRETLTLVALGAGAILALLRASLGSSLRTLRIVAPLACAVACVTAILLASGISLTIFHLVGLLLVVAIGSNYALFFDQDPAGQETGARAQTQVSLVVANLTAVGSFGVLGFSQVPVLSALGRSVGVGTFLALVFAVLLTRKVTHADPLRS